jgi:hypothetical protein
MDHGYLLQQWRAGKCLWTYPVRQSKSQVGAYCHYEYGVDFTMLKGKLNASIDLYDKETTDMLFIQSHLHLFPVDWANGGSISNKGIELSLNATPFSNKNVTRQQVLNGA